MIRQLGILSLGSGLGLCLLCGCTHAPRGDDVRAPFYPGMKEVAGPPAPDPPAPPPAEESENHQARMLDPQRRDLPVKAAPVERARLEVSTIEVPPERPSGPGAPDPPSLLPPSLAPTPPPDPPVVAALRCLADKHPAEALSFLQRYDRGRQELLLTLLPLAARVAEPDFDRATPREKAALVDQLAALSQALRSQAPLVLEHLCFCRVIKGFADYEPLPPTPVFQTGADGRAGEKVHLYVEIRNFNSRPYGPGWETCLTYTLEILNFQQKVMWKHVFPPKVDRKRAPRQDYFANIWFWIPPYMPQGEYTLRLRVRDDTRPAHGDAAPRVAEGSLDFRVGGGDAARGERMGLAPAGTGPDVPR